MLQPAVETELSMLFFVPLLRNERRRKCTNVQDSSPSDGWHLPSALSLVPSPPPQAPMESYPELNRAHGHTESTPRRLSSSRIAPGQIIFSVYAHPGSILMLQRSQLHIFLNLSPVHRSGELSIQFSVFPWSLGTEKLCWSIVSSLIWFLNTLCFKLWGNEFRAKWSVWLITVWLITV